MNAGIDQFGGVLDSRSLQSAINQGLQPLQIKNRQGFTRDSTDMEVFLSNTSFNLPTDDGNEFRRIITGNRSS
ncbi:hypothetical protein GCM10027217_14930 [Pseudomaricurvus hydrocarbonicus]